MQVACRRWVKDLQDDHRREHVLSQLWARSRALAGLPPLHSWDASHADFAKRFFSFSPGANTVWTNSFTGIYVHVWKSASETVLNNVNSQCRPIVRVAPCSLPNGPDPRPHNQIEAEITSRGSPALAFSFVREPLSHFMSGYTPRAACALQPFVRLRRLCVMGA